MLPIKQEVDARRGPLAEKVSDELALSGKPGCCLVIGFLVLGAVSLFSTRLLYVRLYA